MTLPYKMPSHNTKFGYLDAKRIVYSGFINSEEGALKATPAGAINLKYPTPTTERGVKSNKFTSYVHGFYEVYSNDTVDIRVQVSVKGNNDLKGYTLSYLYEENIQSNGKRILLINPNLNNYLYHDYSLIEPTIVEQGISVMKSFKLSNLKISNYSKLSIYITLPLLSGAGNDFVETKHEIFLKKR
ncbi:hypothetical protein H4K35_02975 [Myroides sp. NP-2]|uniref:hypothetical protein n=1 Tax=Myroides sp. NP-2 TaxID=2759945 RepID=UPI0015FBB20F|nr:hypothetical protein [Myroides sp. NP-2]MBB1149101.1 hypothetical protein [Myroides sp. NP-2]